MNVALLDPIDTARAWVPFRLLPIGRRAELATLIDEEDAQWATATGWNPITHTWTPDAVYARRNVGKARVTIYLHQAIMLRRDPPPSLEFMRAHVIDHINGQTLDNRLANLRWVTRSVNALNCRNLRPIPPIEMLVAQLLGLMPMEEAVPF